MMEKIKKAFLKNYSSIIIIVLSISALVLYYVISTTTYNSKKSQVKEIYYADNISSAHRKIIDLFNEKYKGKIQVIPIDLPFSKFSTNERKELLTRALRSKSERIDVFSVDLIWVPRFAKWCEPVDKYFPEIAKEGFLDYSLESCFVDGGMAAIPLYMDISMMYYRSDLLKRIPNYEEIVKKLENSITWEELLELRIYFDPEKNPFYIFPADDYEGLICSYFELILSQDKEYFKSGDYNFSNPIAIKSLQLLVDLVNKYHASPPIVTQFKEQESYKYYLEKDGVFLWGWPSFEKDYKNLLHDLSKEKSVKKAALPHLNGADTGGIFGGWNLMISKSTAYKNEVVEFVKFMTSEQSQLILFSEGAYLPTRKSFYTNENIIANYPQLQYLKKLLDNGMHRPFLKDYTRVSDIISYYVNKAMKNELSVEEALKNADQTIQSRKVIIR